MSAAAAPEGAGRREHVGAQQRGGRRRAGPHPCLICDSSVTLTVAAGPADYQHHRAGR
jgi:hypothetical protein